MLKLGFILLISVIILITVISMVVDNFSTNASEKEEEMYDKVRGNR